MTTVTMNQDGDGVIANPPVSLKLSEASLATWAGVTVNVLMIGQHPMTSCMFNQVATCRYEDMEPLCRLDRADEWWILGRHRETNQLVRCDVETSAGVDDDLLWERDRASGSTGDKDAANPERLAVINNELIPAEHRRVDALLAELHRLPLILLVGQ